MKKVNNTATEEESRSATLTRVRDNQRRSRARRKEYIQSLEQRLRSFERLGVVASQEIQQAGRKVTKENALLRSLLVLRGVTREEIAAFLKSHTESTPQTIPTPAPASQPVSPSIELSLPLGVSEEPPDGKFDTLPMAQSIDGQKVAFHGPPIEARPYAFRHEPVTNQTATESAGNMNANMPTVQQSNGSHHERGHFTSCENAARIIASLRGYTDNHDLRTELGCGAESNCMVKNVNLFEMLDN